MIAASQELRFDFSPVTALWLISVPFLDCIGLILKRLLRGVGPFTADRDHLHHKLMDKDIQQIQPWLLFYAFQYLPLF